MSFQLLGCGQTNDAEYIEHITAGLDYLSLEDYTRAEIQFEQALDIKPEDIEASAYMNQSSHFNRALDAFDKADHEQALVEANHVIDYDHGSRALVAKAETLIADIEALTSSKSSEVDVDKDSEGDVEEGIEEVTDEQASVANVSTETDDPYTFEEIEGYYALFEGEAYASESVMVVIIEEERYIEIIPSWNEILLYDISTKSINENALDIAYEREEPYSGEYEGSDLSAKIQESETDMYNLLINEDVFYGLTEDEASGYGVELPARFRNDS